MTNEQLVSRVEQTLAGFSFTRIAASTTQGAFLVESDNRGDRLAIGTALEAAGWTVKHYGNKVVARCS